MLLDNLVLMVRNLPAVANDVHPTDHLTDSEESNDLCGGDTSESNLLLVGIADAGQNALTRWDVKVLDGSGIAGGIDKRLEVRLECGQVSDMEDVSREAEGTFSGLQWRMSLAMISLTEDTCSGHGKPAWRVRIRLSNSIQ